LIFKGPICLFSNLTGCHELRDITVNPNPKPLFFVLSYFEQAPPALLEKKLITSIDTNAEEKKITIKSNNNYESFMRISFLQFYFNELEFGLDSSMICMDKDDAVRTK
jgi:hypothetical protein